MHCGKISACLFTIAFCIAPIGLAVPTTAQGSDQAQPQPAEPKTGCTPSAESKSPTATARGPDSGTKNMGSTGWSGGGMGGSHNDTTEAGPLSGSGTEHPSTAQGLDPTKPQTGVPSPC